ncbi:MAG TPA: lytic transglycosylase domain-containing protein [Vicinamibacterales bacterium]|jgi:soluble lytic murein transglycosylase-like protein|nr:lytic transglycosylase domain-containing protein [Vicinamibacterales bacterium]
MLNRIAITLLLLGLSVPARAQIYSWRDTNGNLVLSNRRPVATLPVTSYAVPKAQGLRVTRPAVAERGRAYDDLIGEHSRLHGVRPDLVRAVMQVESGFDPSARSPKGAMGLMQLMPATAKQYGVRNAFNPAENVRAGVAYLRGLLDRYQNNEELALAAYNAGPGAVDKHGQTVPPYRETRSYVARINQMAGRAATPRDQTIVKGTDLTADGRAIPSYSNLKH